MLETQFGCDNGKQVLKNVFCLLEIHVEMLMGEKNQCMDPCQCYGVPPRDNVYLLGLKYPFLQPPRALVTDSSQLRITLEAVL